MGFKLKVEGPSTIELGTTIVTGVKFRTDIPKDSNARSTDMGSTVTITGKILTAVDPNAFVVDYKEDYGDVEGVGTFTLIIKQKKDKMAQVAVEGGYSVS